MSAQADSWLKKARAVAETGNLRAAYHSVYRGLDILLKDANWAQVAAELEEICSGQYPVAFAVGAVRFVSSAAERIPHWKAILRKLEEATRREKKDVRRALRGLVEGNAAK